MLNSVLQAHNAYQQSMQNSLATGVSDDISDNIANFGSVLSKTVGDAIATGHTAETQAAKGLSGDGDITQIVSSISKAQMALQTTTVIRDRVVQAYQDVMKMSI